MAKKLPVSKAKPTLAAVPEPPQKAPRGVSLMLQVGLITLPIKLSAGARAEGVSFKKLHNACQSPLKMQANPGDMFCPVCSATVPSTDIARGYEVSKGSYVMLSETEIEEQKPDTDKLVHIDTFVPAADIDPIFCESSYYLSPGEGGAKPFVLVREMLRKTEKVALGKATLYGHEHTVIMRPYKDCLALHQMFHLTELGTIATGLRGIEVSLQEMDLAVRLVEQMSSDFEPAQYHDRYLENIEALVQSKQAGTSPVIPMKRKEPVSIDLLAALSQSVEQTKIAIGRA